MIMLDFLLQLNTCSLGGGINTGNWISVNLILILLIFTLVGMINAIAKLFPSALSKKIMEFVKYEYAQGAISIVIVAVILVFAGVACNLQYSFVPAHSQNPNAFTFAENYLNNLLFVQGIGLVTSLNSYIVKYSIYAGVLSAINPVQLTPGSFRVPVVKNITIKPGSALTDLYGAYITIMDWYVAIVVPVFGFLMIQFLMVPLVQALSLVVVVPVGIAIRCASFFQPKLREAANSFIAIAIAFYFIYPITFVMDSYITSWLFCTGSVASCNPFVSYLDKLHSPLSGNIQNSILSTNPPTPSGGNGQPLSIFGFGFNIFLSNIFTALGNVIPNAVDMITSLLYLPTITQSLGYNVAVFMFQGVFLVAFNMAITVGFALGLNNALNAAAGFSTSDIFA